MESKTTRRGWRWTPSTRAVSRGSSASAVPMPTTTASTARASGARAARDISPEIHFESPVARRDLAVERHRGLEEHPRPAGAGVLAEGLVEQPRAARRARRRRCRPRCPRRAGCPGRGRRPCRSGRRRRRRRGAIPACDDRVGAGRRLALSGSTARARRRASRRRGRRRLRRRCALTSACGPPYSSCQPSPRTLAVAHDHRADERVRVHAPEAAVRELDGALQVLRGRCRSQHWHALESYVAHAPPGSR